MLFGASHPEDLVIGPIVVGLVTCWVGSLIQFFVVWLRSRCLNEQLTMIQNSMPTRTIQVVQATVYRKE
jgi:hypothetical protein